MNFQNAQMGQQGSQWDRQFASNQAQQGEQNRQWQQGFDQSGRQWQQGFDQNGRQFDRTMDYNRDQSAQQGMQWLMNFMGPDFAGYGY